ncbi:MAG: EpsG family protein [Klebsiella huaxiensis]|uniref:EpsG family protein n=1 Tax=Klebsiella huaxiensis TaxID=2153354 RepID=UPI0026F2B9A7|nr:EpsG family protein [Klebsiella huaxiensis]WEJ92059.1 MAG: EpsG family protein [Klebsiella huaxiensis]
MTLFIVNLILLLCAIKENERLYKLSLILIAACFILSFGRSYDWINYYDVYININDYGIVNLPFEPGLFWVMKVFDSVGLPFSILNGCMELFIFYSVYQFCKNKENKSLSLFILFAIMGNTLLTEQIRQGLAFAIILRFYYLFEEKKNLKSCLVILIAMLFHMSAVICFLFFPLNKKHGMPSIIKFSIYCVAFLIVSYFLWLKPDLVSSIGILYGKLVDYKNSYTEGFVSWSNLYESKVLILYLAILTLTFIIRRKKKNTCGVGIDSSIKALIFMSLTKITVFFGRFQYFMLPIFISGIDKYFTSSSPRRISFYKILLLVILYFISLTPFWSNTYVHSMNDPVYLFSSKSDISSTINRRCAALHAYDKTNNAIIRCR